MSESSDDSVTSERRGPKRVKLTGKVDSESHFDPDEDTHPSLVAQPSRPISPPPLKRVGMKESINISTHILSERGSEINDANNLKATRLAREIPSPFYLTRIKDLPDEDNVDTVTLKDLLGDPLIKECWQFNYMFDVDFLMSSFDQDVQHLVQVNIMHGYWRHEDPSRQAIQSAVAKYPNVKVFTAYMPEPFGTHHSKMMVLFRHDDTAQIVIHTANIIEQDWQNLCQAVWQSERLPLIPQEGTKDSSSEIGEQFKKDFLSYTSAYGKSKTGSLTEQLGRYDFGSVRAALVGSVPGKYNYNDQELHAKEKRHPQDRRTAWGWIGLEQVLSTIPISNDSQDTPRIVCQVSSIATLDQTGRWLANFQRVLNKSSNFKNTKTMSPHHHIIFPTPEDVRKSLEGYASGASIHTKVQSAAQQKQVDYLRPLLCRWGATLKPAPDEKERETGAALAQIAAEAGRRRAAPHIKTYIRFHGKNLDTIDWAMITSANLSTQAWGAMPNKNGEVRVSSWELGVVVWPGLWSDHQCREDAEDDSSLDEDGEPRVTMKPAFKSNTASITSSSRRVVAIRLPYDIPLTPYKSRELPWCATADHFEPDWRGRIWRNSG